MKGEEGGGEEEESFARWQITGKNIPVTGSLTKSPLFIVGGLGGGMAGMS